MSELVSVREGKKGWGALNSSDEETEEVKKSGEKKNLRWKDGRPEGKNLNRLSIQGKEKKEKKKKRFKVACRRPITF